MPYLGVVNNPKGKARIWENPSALLADFEAFLNEQQPHVVPETGELSSQGVISILQFAVWKGVHRTTITTGYSQGDFQEVYQYMLGTCEAYAERKLYDARYNAAHIIFILKHSYGWSDKRKSRANQIVDVPLSEEAKAYLSTT